jgi:hypothetical protein
MSRADSIRQTASMARWVSVVTATDHTIVTPPAQGSAAADGLLLLRQLPLPLAMLVDGLAGDEAENFTRAPLEVGWSSQARR